MPQRRTFKFDGIIWMYPGPAAWHFITLPKSVSEQIKFYAATKKSPWGSVRIAARIGQTQWQTSVFPDKKSGSHLIPIKKDIRKKAALTAGQRVKIQLQIEL